MRVEVRKLDGSSTGSQVDLKKEVFGIEPREHAVYLTVKSELANNRQGSANTKTRAEVKGSGAKLWRQKGTGRARVGDIRTPIRRGGGVVFGPKPRSYSLKVNRKVRTLARKSVLSTMQQEERIIVVEALKLENHKTRIMASALEALGLRGKRVMVLAGTPSDELWLAARNLPDVRVKSAADVSTYDVWSSDYLLIDKEGIKKINTALGS
ncbi:MAG: 50S ribosomal protein L4 [Fidelibacterota bacterium]|nr:MAG: 50S ribosomal protein L4 [Candidatus Neomarinimicrobiota bacterium]